MLHLMRQSTSSQEGTTLDPPRRGSLPLSAQTSQDSNQSATTEGRNTTPHPPHPHLKLVRSASSNRFHISTFLLIVLIKFKSKVKNSYILSFHPRILDDCLWLFQLSQLHLVLNSILDGDTPGRRRKHGDIKCLENGGDKIPRSESLSESLELSRTSSHRHKVESEGTLDETTSKLSSQASTESRGRSGSIGKHWHLTVHCTLLNTFIETDGTGITSKI